MKVLNKSCVCDNAFVLRSTSRVSLHSCLVSKDEFFFRKINRKFSVKSDMMLFKFPKLNEQREKSLLFFRNSIWVDEEYFREKSCLKILLFFKNRRFASSFSGRENDLLDKNAIRKYLKFMMTYLENSLVEDVTQINSKFFIFLYFLTKCSVNSVFSLDSVIKRKLILRNLFFIFFFFEGRLRYFFNLNKFNYLITNRYWSFNLNRRLVKIFFPKGLFLVLYSPFKSSYSFSSTTSLLNHKKHFFSKVVSMNLLVRRSLRNLYRRKPAFTIFGVVPLESKKLEFRRLLKHKLFDKPVLEFNGIRRRKKASPGYPSLKSRFNKRIAAVPFVPSFISKNMNKLASKDFRTLIFITDKNKKLLFFHHLKLFFRQKFILSNFLISRLNFLRSKTKEKYVMVRRVMQFLLFYNRLVRSSMKVLTLNLIYVRSKWNFVKVLKRSFILKKLLANLIWQIASLKRFNFLEMRSDGVVSGYILNDDSGVFELTTPVSEGLGDGKLFIKSTGNVNFWVDNSLFLSYKLKSSRRNISNAFYKLYFSDLYYSLIFKSLLSVFSMYSNEFLAVFQKFFFPYKLSSLLNFVVVAKGLTCSDLIKILTIYFEFLLRIYSFNFSKKRSNYVNYLEARDTSQIFSLCTHYPVLKIFQTVTVKEFKFNLISFIDFLIFSFKSYFSNLMIDKLMVTILDRKPVLHTLRRRRKTAVQLLILHRRNLANIEDIKLNVAHTVKSKISTGRDDNLVHDLLYSKTQLLKRKSQFEFLKQKYLRSKTKKHRKKRTSEFSPLFFSAKNKFIKRFKGFLRLKRLNKMFFRRYLSKRERRRFLRRFTVHLLFAIKFIKEKKLKNSYYKYNLRSMRLSRFHKYSTPYFLKLKIKRFVSFDNLRKKVLHRFSFSNASSVIGSSIRRFVMFFHSENRFGSITKNYFTSFFISDFCTGLTSLKFELDEFFYLKKWLFGLKNLYCIPVLDSPLFLRYWTILMEYVLILNFVFRKGLLCFFRMLFFIFSEIDSFTAFFKEVKSFCFIVLNSKIFHVKIKPIVKPLKTYKLEIFLPKRHYSSRSQSSLISSLYGLNRMVKVKKIKLFFNLVGFTLVSPAFFFLSIFRPIRDSSSPSLSSAFFQQYLFLVYFGILYYKKSIEIFKELCSDFSFLEFFPKIFSVFSFRFIFHSAVIPAVNFFKPLISLSSKIGFFTFFYVIIGTGYSLLKRNQLKIEKIKNATQTRGQRFLRKNLRLIKSGLSRIKKKYKQFGKKKKKPRKFYMYAHVLYKRIKHPGRTKKSDSRVRKLLKERKSLRNLREFRKSMWIKALKATKKKGVGKKPHSSAFKAFSGFRFLKMTNYFLGLLNSNNSRKNISSVVGSSSFRFRNHFLKQFRIFRGFLHKRFQCLTRKNVLEKFISRSRSFNDRLKLVWTPPSILNGLFVSPKKNRNVVLRSETFFRVFFASSVLSGAFLESKLKAVSQLVNVNAFSRFFKNLTRLKAKMSFSPFGDSRVFNIVFIFKSYESRLRKLSFFLLNLQLHQYLVLVSKVISQVALLKVFLLNVQRSLLPVILSFDSCFLLDLGLFFDLVNAEFLDLSDVGSSILLSLVFDNFSGLNCSINISESCSEFFIFPCNFSLFCDFKEDVFCELFLELFRFPVLFLFDDWFFLHSPFLVSRDSDLCNIRSNNESVFVENVGSISDIKLSFSELIRFYVFVREYFFLQNLGFYSVPLNILLLRFSRSFIDFLVNLGHLALVKDKVLNCWFVRLEQSFFLVIGGILYVLLNKCLSFKQFVQEHFFVFMHFLNAFFFDILFGVKVFNRVYFVISRFFSDYFFANKKFSDRFDFGFKSNIIRFVLNKFKYYSDHYCYALFSKRYSSIQVLNLDTDVKSMRVKRYKIFFSQNSLEQVPILEISEKSRRQFVHSGFAKILNYFFESNKMQNLDCFFSRRFINRFKILWVKKFLFKRYFLYCNSFFALLKKIERTKYPNKYSSRKVRRRYGLHRALDKFYRISYSFSSRFPLQFRDLMKYRRFRNLQLFSFRSKFFKKGRSKLRNFFDSSSSFFSHNFRNRYRKRRRLVFHKRHLVLKSRFHPLIRYKVLLGFFLSPRFLSFKFLNCKDFFFMDNLRFKLRRKLSFFFRMNRFLEFLIKLLHKVRTYVFYYSKDPVMADKLRVLDSFLSNKYFYSLFGLYKKVKARMRRFLLRLLFFFRKKTKRITNLYRRRKSSVNFVLKRLRFLFFYNFLGLNFLKFFILRYVFVGDFIRYRFQFINRFLWFRSVHINSILISPKIFIVITKVRNNFFITGIDLYGRTFYKTSPGIVNFTGSDRMSKYAWFAAAIDFCEGFLEFLRYYLRGRRRRRFSLFRVMQVRRTMNKELALQKRLGDAFDYKRSLRYRRRLNKKRAKQRVRLRKFFVISKGISNFNLRIFLKGMFSVRFSVSKFFSGAVNYPMRSFSLCRIKKVRRI